MKRRILPAVQWCYQKQSNCNIRRCTTSPRKLLLTDIHTHCDKVKIEQVMAIFVGQDNKKPNNHLNLDTWDLTTVQIFLKIFVSELDETTFQGAGEGNTEWSGN